MNEIMEFLLEAMLKGLKGSGHGYKVDILIGQNRASQIPYCSRKNVFQNSVTPEQEKILQQKYSQKKLQKKGDSGSLVHILFQFLLKESGLKILNEDELFLPVGDIAFFGHIDILIFEFKGKIYCIDIKTTETFFYLDQDNKPNDKHLKQLMVYLSYLKKKYPKMEIVGGIWYVIRVTNAHKIIQLIDLLLNIENWRFFDVWYDIEMFSNLVLKAINIMELAKEDKLPEMDGKSWECSNKTATCIFYDFCHTQYIEKLSDFFKILPHFIEIIEKEMVTT